MSLHGGNPFSDIKSKFAVRAASGFSFSFKDIQEMQLVPVDSLHFLWLLQGDSLASYKSPEYEHYFYSFQDSTEYFYALTLILNTEYQWDIYYLTYDQQGKLIDKFPVAGHGGDGPFENYSHGNFVNDSTYVRTDVAKEYADNGVVTDSTQQTCVVSRRGTVQCN